MWLSRAQVERGLESVGLLDHVIATRTIEGWGVCVYVCVCERRGSPSAGKEERFGPEKGCKHVKDPTGAIFIL